MRALFFPRARTINQCKGALDRLRSYVQNSPRVKGNFQLELAQCVVIVNHLACIHNVKRTNTSTYHIERETRWLGACARVLPHLKVSVRAHYIRILIYTSVQKSKHPETFCLLAAEMCKVTVRHVSDKLDLCVVG